MKTTDRQNYEYYLKKLPYLKSKLSKDELTEVEVRYKMAQSLSLESFKYERWLSIRGTNGLYSISNYARVRRNEYVEKEVGCRGRILKGVSPKILKQRIHKGYCYTMISVGNKTRAFRVHRELSIHFKKNPNNKQQVNHKNGIRYDNRLINLEWSTHGENQKHSFRCNGREPYRVMLGKTGVLCPNSKAVIQMTLEGAFIKEWGGASEAARKLGLFQSAISNACVGKNKTSGGFTWKYK